MPNDPITLDARPDRIDLRDRAYQPPLRNLEPRFPDDTLLETFFPLYAEHDMVLDQGSEGACTGFGLAAMINYLMWRRGIENHLRAGETLETFTPPEKVSTRMLYHLARFYDEWPGEDYEGSSCRGAIKAWHRHGVCSDACWPYRNPRGRAVFVSPAENWDLDAAKRPLGVYYRIDKESLTDMQAAIQEVGAIYVSATVHQGWNSVIRSHDVSHGGLPLIAWDDDQEATGGHAFALVGYNDKGFIVQNSWADRWGEKGLAILGYRDWLTNGSDAWVCVLGAPRDVPMPRYYVSSRVSSRANLRGPARLSDSDAITAASERAVRPWDEAAALKHTLIMGNEGKVINRLVENAGPKQTAARFVFEGPKEFFEANPGAARKVAIYAHGGLNEEGDSLARIRSLGPYFEANGIYPLFMTWKTGVWESLVNIMEDGARRVFPFSRGISDLFDAAQKAAEEALDRTLEVASANLGVKAVWSQMKQNAQASATRSANDRGGFLTALNLARLLQEFPDLEIHLIGHSAGSILLGHMLGDFPRNDLKVKTFTLYAPACTVDFANRHIAGAVRKEVLAAKHLHLDILSERRERDDTVGPYRKSLLYLVSRALEDWHKTPLLGMHTAIEKTDRDTHIWSSNTHSGLEKWREFMQHGVSQTLVDRKEVTTALDQNDAPITIPAAHGSFDNDIDVVTATLMRILGGPLKTPVRDLRY